MADRLIDDAGTAHQHIPAIPAIMAELRELREIVAKLPVTADGVRMVPGGHYWALVRDELTDPDIPWEVAEVIWWKGGGERCFNPEYTFADEDDYRLWEYFDVGGVYSTHEAARQAKEAE